MKPIRLEWLLVLGAIGVGACVVILVGSDCLAQKVESICTVLLFLGTAAYAWSAYFTFRSMERARLDSSIPLVALRFFDHVSQLPYNIQNPSNDEERKALSAILPQRYAVRMVNVGKGPAMNIKLWSNLETTNGVWTGRYSDKITEWPDKYYAFGCHLGVDNGNADLLIEFVTSNAPLILDNEAILLVQYTDMFRRWFLTTHVLRLQGLASLDSPIDEKSFDKSELLNVLKRHGSTAKTTADVQP